MAKLKGTIQFTGTLDELSFYETAQGIIVRRKWGPDKDRLKKDPAFKPIRNHSLEFGACAKAAKLLRDCLRTIIKDCFDNSLTPRLNKLMNEVKNFDKESDEGKRNVSAGFKETKACELLKGFDFNEHSPIDQVVRATYQINPTKDFVTILEPGKKIVFPEEATHCILKSGYAIIDFKTQTHNLQCDDMLLMRTHTKKNIQLTIKNTSTLKGLHVFVLSATFLQEITGNYIPLNEKRKNSCAIINATMN